MGLGLGGGVSEHHVLLVDAQPEPERCAHLGLGLGLELGVRVRVRIGGHRVSVKLRG